jgi:hypothetical protein
VLFTADFGGARDQDAVVHVYVYPEGTPEREARHFLEAFLSSRGVPGGRIDPRTASEDGRIYPWSEAEEGYSFQTDAAEWILGTIILGRHAGRSFHIVVQYPEAYAEGFVPRAEMILETWRWEDTGERLGRAFSPQRREGAP